MKICRFAVLTMLGVLIALTGLPLSGQEIPEVQEGDRVRVALLSGDLRRVEGLLQGTRQDTLFVLSNDAPEAVKIPWSQVDGLSIYRGEEGHPWTGFVIGLGSGALLGYAVGRLEGGDDPSECDNLGMCMSSEDKSVLWSVVLGLVGGGLGKMIGGSYKTDKWEQVSREAITPSVLLAPTGRIGIGVSVPLGR